MSAERKVGLLAGAEALLNPIRWPEPYGLVVLEALACGTPVLTFKQGAAPVIVEHGVTGFLSADEDDMVTHLRRLDELDRRACRAAVERHFSTGRMVAEHVDLYQQLLDGRMPRTAIDQADPVSRSSARLSGIAHAVPTRSRMSWAARHRCRRRH